MDIKKRIAEIDLFLFDMDGTLYLGNQLFDFTVELLSEIKKRGKRYLYMTNNSSKSVGDYVKKLERLGIRASGEEFITSAQATALYLSEQHPGKTLYVCGTESLQNELRENGFQVTSDPDRAECIVMGFDTELTFRKIEDVSKLLQTREIPYIATNPDLVCPTEYGYVPDCGSMCEMLFHATGKKPVVIGKPSPIMPETALKMTGCARERTAVVGDRIYTDIKSGLNAKLFSILVMNGETTPEILEASEEKPDLVLQSAGEILTALSAC